MFCTNCGADIGSDAFCTKCGTPAEGYAPPEMPAFTDSYEAPAAPEDTPAEEIMEEAGEGTVCPVYGESSAPQAPVGMDAPVNPAYRPGTGPEPEPVTDNKAPVRRVLAEAMSSPLLLTMGILLLANAVLCILSLSGSGSGGAYLAISLALGILDGVALLLAVSAAKKGGELYQGEGTGLLRGMLKTHYVLGWVAFGCLLLAAVLVIACRSLVMPLFGDYFNELETYGYSITGLSYGGYAQTYDTFFTVIFWFVAAGLVLAAILLMLQNIFFAGNLVRMGKGVMTSLQTGDFYVQGVRAVRGWSMATFVIQILSVLGTAGTMGAVSILAGGCMAAVYLLLFIWVGKHFIPNN